MGWFTDPVSTPPGNGGGLFGWGPKGGQADEVNRLQILGAMLQDISQNMQGKTGGAIPGVQTRMQRLHDQENYKKTIGMMFQGPQGFDVTPPTINAPQVGMPTVQDGKLVPYQPPVGAASQPAIVNPGSVTPTGMGAQYGIPDAQANMLATILPELPSSVGIPMMFNAIQGAQERDFKLADKKADREQMLADKRERPATAEEKKTWGYADSTPVFVDGLGTVTVRQDPNAITPLQQAQLGISREQLNLQRMQAGDAAMTRKLANAKAVSELSEKANQKAGAAEGYDAAINTLDKMMKMPGFSAAVGANIPVLDGIPFVGAYPGSARADFEATLDTLKSQTFLPMVQSLKGMGALSNAEGEKLTNAIGALSTSMSESAFRSSVADIRNRLAAARERNGGAPAQTPANAKPSVSNW